MSIYLKWALIYYNKWYDLAQKSTAEQRKKLENDQRDLAREQQKLIGQSLPQRRDYTQKMTEIIDSVEKVMRQNIDSISNCITDFS